MKKSLAHLPKKKQTELMLITEKNREIVLQAEMIFYKIAVFQLNQAVEHAYKTVLLIFGGERPSKALS